MSVHRSSSRALRAARVVLTGVLALALALGAALIQPPAPAAAATGSDAAGNPVVFDAVTVEPREFTDGAQLRVNVDWRVDGRAAGPIEIGLTLPDWIRGSSDYFLLRGESNNVIGDCLVTPERIDCTVTDEDYIETRPLDFHGTFEFRMFTVLDNTTVVTPVAVIGNQEVPLTVRPRDRSGGQCNGCTYRPAQPEKFGQYLNASGSNQVDRIRWVVRVGDIPAGTQPGDLRAMGGPVAPGTEIVLRDPGIGDGMTITRSLVRAANSVRRGADGNEVLNFEDVPEAQLDWNDDKTEVRWIAQGAPSGDLGPNRNGEQQRGLGGTVYEVEWMVTLDDRGASAAYYNSATFTVDGRSSGTLSAVSRRSGGSGSAVGTREGQLRITKAVEGEAPTGEAADYRIRVDAFTSGGRQIGSETATLAPGASHLTNRYGAGTRIVVTEEAPDWGDGVDWDVRWEDAASGGTSDTASYEVVLSLENRNVARVSEVTLTNTATPRFGTFEATKTVENPDGLPVPADAEYTLHYGWLGDMTTGVSPGSGSMRLRADGTVAVSDPIPAGVVVTVAEEPPAPVAGGTWREPSFSARQFTMTASSEPAERVVVTNRIDRDLGGFAVTKTVDGPAADRVPDGTVFEVEWSHPAVNGAPAASGVVEVTAGGPAATVEGLPAGAEVTFAERLPAVPWVDWDEPAFEPGQVTVAAGDPVAVALTNTARHQAVTTSSELTLPLTGGAGAGTFALLGGGIAAAGASAALILRRRRSPGA